MYNIYYKGKHVLTGNLPSQIPGVKVSRLDLLTESELNALGITMTPYIITPLSAEEQAIKLQGEIIDAIQDHMDTHARQYGFASIHTAGIWAGLRPHADTLLAWGAACWAVGDQIKADVLAGLRETPTVEQVISELPVYEEA
jgi:hypothetical protein